MQSMEYLRLLSLASQCAVHLGKKGGGLRPVVVDEHEGGVEAGGRHRRGKRKGIWD